MKMRKISERYFLTKKKIRSSSLSYALLVIIVIGALLLSLIMFVSFSSNIFTKLESENDLIETAKSTVNYALANHTAVTEEFKKTGTEALENSFLKKQKWGFLNLLQYKVIFKKDTIKETLFIENIVNDNTALVLLKNEKHFHLGGKSIIEGDIKVPFGKIVNLNLSGVKNVVNHKGNLKEAVDKLPELKDFYLNQELEIFGEEEIDKKSYNSFFNKTKKIILSSNTLQGIKLSGNYILESNKELTIKSNNILEDVIIKCPSIKIEEGFKGVIQVIATEKVIIQKNVTLKYPSVVYVKGENQIIDITIGENSKISGVFIAVSNRNEDNKVYVSKNVTIVGDFYASSKVQFKGEMYGTMYANEFYLNTGESEYKNALLNFKLKKTPDSFQKINIVDTNETLCTVIKRKK